MQRIRANDRYEFSTVGDPVLSPDGETVAYVRETPANDREYETVIETVPTTGGERRRFTSEGSASLPRFSPSGDRLAFISARTNDLPQLWVAPTDGGEAQRVTDVPGGLAGVTWSPDGEKIAFVQETTDGEREGDDVSMDEEYKRESPDPRVIDRLTYRIESAYRTARSWETYFDGTRVHVYVIDLETTTVTRVTDGDVDHAVPTWGNADELYYLRKPGDDESVRYELRVADLEAGTDELVTETYIHPGLTLTTLSATADGRILFPTDHSTEKRISQSDLAVYDCETDTTTVITEKFDRKAAHAPLVEWGPNNEYAYFTVPDEGRTSVCRVHRAGGEVECIFTGDDVNGVAVGSDRLAVTMSEWDHPGDVFAVEDGEATRLTEINADFLAERSVCKPEEIWFSTTSETTAPERQTNNAPDIHGWVVTPPDFDPKKEYPAIVEVHGGPVAMWSASGTMWHEFQTLANEGYVVFWSNPRGSVGYGHDFCEAVAGDWGGPYYEDLMAGTDALVAHDYIDEDNVFITGGSYGGYMTAWTIGQTDRFKAANPQRGVYDLKTMYGTSSVGHLLEFQYAGAYPWRESERFWRDSPIAYVDDVDTPTLIFQNETDYNTPAADSEMYYHYLKKAGKVARLVRYPRDGHELSRSGEPRHIIDRIDRLRRWFDSYSDHNDTKPSIADEATVE